MAIGGATENGGSRQWAVGSGRWAVGEGRGVGTKWRLAAVLGFVAEMCFSRHLLAWAWKAPSSPFSSSARLLRAVAIRQGRARQAPTGAEQGKPVAGCFRHGRLRRNRPGRAADQPAAGAVTPALVWLIGLIVPSSLYSRRSTHTALRPSVPSTPSIVSPAK
jgi:hypothetical protein